MKYKLIFIFTALILICVWYYKSYNKISIKPANTILVKSYKVENHIFYDKFNSIGKSINDQSKDFYANKAGTVDKITSKQGRNIEAKEFILSINGELAKSALISSKTNLDNTKQDYKRVEQLLIKKVASTQQVEAARVIYENAKASYYQAENDYNNMVLTAPFRGNIGVINTNIGSNVNVGDYLFSIVGDGPISISCDLPESLFSKISKDTEVQLSDSNGNNSKGHIIFFAPYLSDKGTMTVKVQSTSNHNFLHGSYINVQFIINKHKAIGLPEQLVLKNDKGNFIYKIENGIAKQYYLKLGYRTDNMIEVLDSNVSNGDLIILEGLTKVFDGAEVKIVN